VDPKVGEELRWGCRHITSQLVIVTGGDIREIFAVQTVWRAAARSDNMRRRGHRQRGGGGQRGRTTAMS
jgi:hypothetical protein